MSIIGNIPLSIVVRNPVESQKRAVIVEMDMIEYARHANAWTPLVLSLLICYYFF